LGLTQEQLSGFLGLDWKSVSNIEIGSRKPNKLAAAVMRALDDLPSKKAQDLMDLLRKYMEK
jgi:DNA-binding transcriptional regulator YiaG